MKFIKPAFAYFGLVFGTGFVLGIVRVLLVVPQLGERMAELFEMPLMVLAIMFAARWIVRRFDDQEGQAHWLAIGGMALGLILLAELWVGIWLRGLSPREVWLARDPVSGSAYYLGLLLFAAMPWLYVRHRTHLAPGSE